MYFKIIQSMHSFIETERSLWPPKCWTFEFQLSHTVHSKVLIRTGSVQNSRPWQQPNFYFTGFTHTCGFNGVKFPPKCFSEVLSPPFSTLPVIPVNSDNLLVKQKSPGLSIFIPFSWDNPCTLQTVFLRGTHSSLHLELSRFERSCFGCGCRCCRAPFQVRVNPTSFPTACVMRRAVIFLVIFFTVLDPGEFSVSQKKGGS